MDRLFTAVKAMLAVLCTIGVWVPAWAQQDDPALRSRFVKGVMQASAKIERLSFRAKCKYSSQNISVSEEVRESFLKRKADPYKLDIREFECAMRGPLCLDRRKNKRGIDSYQVRNGSYAFSIWRTSEGGPTTLQFLEQLGVNPTFDSKIAAIEKQARCIALGGFHLWGDPLSQLVQGNDFKIQRVYAVQADDGNKLVRVEFDHEINDPIERVHIAYLNSFLICDPDNEWALTEYGCTHENYIHNKNSGMRHVRLEYGDPVLGVPIAKKAEETITLTRMPGNTMQVTYSVEVISPDEVPEEEFYLSFYGLPEPNFSRSWVGPWLWYLIVGAVCLGVGAIILKRRKARG